MVGSSASGEFICDCEGLLDDADIDRVESAQELAEYIVKLHNSHLDRAAAKNIASPHSKIPFTNQ